MLKAYLYQWAITMFVLQLASPLLLLILCDAGASLGFSRIQQATALVDLKRHSYNNQTNVQVLCIIFSSPLLYKLVHWHAITWPSTCNVLLSSILLRSNRITLQTPVYRVFNHAIWLIKARHSHSLCSKIEFIRHPTPVCLFW